MTLEEIFKAKAQLEADMLEAFAKFEEATDGAVVAGTVRHTQVDVTTANHTSRRIRTASVTVELHFA